MKVLATATVVVSATLGGGMGVKAAGDAFPCAPATVTHRLTAMLDAFDTGRARAFARGFTLAGHFEPYNGGPRRYAASRHRGIEAIVRLRHRAGDRWTMLAVNPPPNVERTSEAVYGLRLRVERRRTPPYVQGAKIVIPCSSGRIRIWLGPVWTAA